MTGIDLSAVVVSLQTLLAAWGLKVLGALAVLAAGRIVAGAGCAA